MHSFSGLSSGFSLCALRTARQQSWLPGSDGLRYSSSCGKLPVIEVVQHPPLAGSGVQLAPRWGMGAWSARKGCQWQAFNGKRAGRPRKSPIVLPVKFLFRILARINCHFPRSNCRLTLYQPAGFFDTISSQQGSSQTRMRGCTPTADAPGRPVSAKRQDLHQDKSGCRSFFRIRASRKEAAQCFV